jgi:hypothetical protein
MHPCGCHIVRGSGILRAAASQRAATICELIVQGKRPAASAASAGMFLLGALVLCVGIGVAAGWLGGYPYVGAAVGASIGIPLSFYLVYRRYRDII